LETSVLLLAIACGEAAPSGPALQSDTQRGSITNAAPPEVQPATAPPGSGVAGFGAAGLTGGGVVPVGQLPPDPVVAGRGGAGMSAGGSAAGMQAGGDAAIDAGTRAPSEGEGTPMDLGKGDGSDVITIGDSWMLLLPGLGIEVSLERSAMNDYRNYAVPGTRIDAIVQQYAAAKQADPEIATVVMAAGGNDILQDFSALLDCPMLGMTCRTIIESVLQKVDTLWAQMAEDGVHDVVIIMYSRPPMDALGLQPSLDYSAEITEKACSMAPLRCTLVAAGDVFGAQNYISADTIHPTEEGYDLLGDATHEAMVETGARR
jgi:lysophospholipase L1-like esterase